MCGIAGSINYRLDIPQLTKDMFHRGPDEQTTFQASNLQLHHHRLAILDIAAGRQPMCFQEFTIIFNGEIYNHLDVRAKHGLVCKTNSDTETIIHSYAKYGPACLNDFDGMFTIAIFDVKKNELFIARDRAGKKPFYYYSQGDKLVFASELKSIVGQLPLQINHRSLHDYVRMGYFFKSATPYRDVWELPAGSYAVISLSKPSVHVQRWWDIHSFYKKTSGDSFETALEKVEGMLHRAVRNRVESSDLEVGSFLSGGIDSGLVTAIASEYNRSLKTFTVSFPGEYNEAPLAKLVADKYQTSHHEINISFDRLREDTERILANYGEPHYDDSAIPSYYVSREAKKFLTVILNGDGGDELFGGYRRYVPFAKMDFFKQNKLRSSLFNLFYRLAPNSGSKMSKMNHLKRMFFLGSRSGFDTYLSATTDIFEGYENTILPKEYVQPGEEILADFARVFESDLSGLQKLMLLDFDNILPSLLLVKMDIATMAHSLEGRSPLLCRDLLEYVPTIKDNAKIRGLETKYLLRQLAKKYLPGEIIHQPKRGFEPPLQHWVDFELRDIIGDYIHSGNALYPAFVDQTFITRLFDRKINVQPEKRAKMLWMIFTLEVWYRKVYKKS